jgi:predicted transcriptional regulator of viral defense system
MNLDDFLKRVRGLPVIDAENLLAGVTNPAAIKVQLSRWRKAGKLIKLKNNIYLLAESFRKVDIHEPYIASVLKKPSYISLEKAFEYYGLIPEGVPVYTCVTTKRPGRITTPIGTFDYRHIKNSLFWGYDSFTVNKQPAFIASPEKALLDFFYLKGLQIDDGYLEEMRLQNTRKINFSRLIEYARKFESPGVLRVARVIKEYAAKRKKEEKHL